MESSWDGRERRRGQSLEELRERLRQLQKAWEAGHRQTQPEDPEPGGETTDQAVQGDNDEERLVRVDAMVETLRTTKSNTRRPALRWKLPVSRRRVSKKDS